VPQASAIGKKSKKKAKNVIFLSKYLHISKKYRTFAPAKAFQSIAAGLQRSEQATAHALGFHFKGG